MSTKKNKILFIDIETAPSIGAYFNRWQDGNIVWVESDWYIMSFSFKWKNKSKTKVIALTDFPDIYKKNKEDDSMLCHEIYKIFNEADIIVAHNGDQFDIKKINTRFLINGINPPSPYKTIDTKKVAKKYFGFESNSLNELARQFGIESKLPTDKELWKKCLSGDLKAWEYMKKYNKYDVIILEKVYDKMKHWIENHPDAHPEVGKCKVCEGTSFEKRGTENRVGKPDCIQRVVCKTCGKWASYKIY